MEILGLTLETLGTIMIAYTALAVHDRLRKEHRVDGKVFASIGKELMIGRASIALVLLGYILQVISKI